MRRPSGSTIVTGVIALLVGVGIGGASGAEDPEVAVQPTPQVIVVTPEPQEQPTPRVETVTEYIETEVEVVPDSCTDALFAADLVINENIDLLLAILGAYVDYPDEDLVQFGRRVEDIIMAYDTDESTRLFDDYTALADECLGF